VRFMIERMSPEFPDNIKRKIVERNYDYITKFNVNEYKDNPPLIEKLFEDKQIVLEASINLEEKVHQLTDTLNQLELKNQKLSLERENIKRQSLHILLLSLLSVTFMGLGQIL
jgi:hypothetical protein